MKLESTARYQAHGAAGGPAPRARRARPLRRGIAAVLLSLQLAGCYTYVPASAPAVPAGTQVSVAVNDQGRIALSEPVGPGVHRLQGHVLAASDSSLVLAVSSVRFVDLPVPAQWRGERVELARGHVGEVLERRLSRTRSWIAAGFLTAAAIVISGFAISGFGGSDPTDRTPGGDGEPS